MTQEWAPGQAFADEALHLYPVPASATARLLSHSENSTFLVATETPFGVLRVCREGYQSPLARRSELAWISAIRENGVVRTPQPLPGANGELLQFVEVDGEERPVSMFEYIPGVELGDDDMESFAVVGSIAARMHGHVESWERPTWFERPTWDLESIFGPGAPWGDWRSGLGLTAEGRVRLEHVESRIREGLTGYSPDATNFGLIHGDLRAANLIVDARHDIWVIDFDDCGFGWLLWDLCSTTTFIEHADNIDEVVKAWIAGYTAVRSLDDRDIAAIPHLVMLRRMHVLAWLGTHSQSDAAKAFGETYAEETLDLADLYMKDDYLSELGVA